MQSDEHPCSLRYWKPYLLKVRGCQFELLGMCVFVYVCSVWLCVMLWCTFIAIIATEGT